MPNFIPICETCRPVVQKKTENLPSNLNTRIGICAAQILPVMKLMAGKHCSISYGLVNNTVTRKKITEKYRTVR